jgi:hypothetical protein
MRRFFLLVCCCACATTRPEPPAPAHPIPPPTAAVTTSTIPEPPADPRELPAQATFADLVDAARATDGAGEAHSEAGCLLRPGETPRLEADLLPAARPLPRPASDLATSIEPTVGAVGVLSAWGNVSGEVPDVVLLAFTTTTPQAVRNPIVALFVTRGGTFVRAADPVLRAQRAALSNEAAAALLTRLSGPAVVYVTAEAEVPLRSLLELLRAIPNRLEIGLAVALLKTTRLPPPAAEDRTGLCPDGLPAPGKNEREGSLAANDAQTAFGPLRDAALSCALATGGRALLGGHLVLGMRLAADGSAPHVCFVADAVGEPMLRRCLISAARDLHLPAPKGGFVDLNVPLELALVGPPAQRASCE